MKLWTLIENTACRTDLAAEHGLSLYLEIGHRRILFDAGQTESFADNASLMGVDLSKVDTAILSHGHYDHGGGLKRFLCLNEKAPLYLSRYAFGLHFNGSDAYIGLNPALKDSDRLRLTKDREPLGDGMTLFSCNCRNRPYFFPCAGLTRKSGTRLLAEDFRHEQYLLVEEQGKRILISGCSHKGILNLLHWFHPDVLIGGLHLMKMDPQGEEIKQIAADLKASGTVFYTCHCTGLEQYEYLKSILGDQLHYLSAGTTLEL